MATCSHAVRSGMPALAAVADAALWLTCCTVRFNRALEEPQGLRAVAYTTSPRVAHASVADVTVADITA